MLGVGHEVEEYDGLMDYRGFVSWRDVITTHNEVESEFVMKAKTKITIVYEIDDCSDCPKHTADRTPRSGYAMDYFCSAADNKPIAGYIEWPQQMPEVPSWCPFREPYVFKDFEI